MADSVYDATGSKPTNYDAFEDTVTDKATESAESLQQALSNEAFVAALSSAVGSIIWQSWQSKDSASKETNMFAALSAIIEESKSTTQSIQSTATLASSMRVTVDKIEEDSDDTKWLHELWFDWMIVDKSAKDNTKAYQDLMLDAIIKIVDNQNTANDSTTAEDIAKETAKQTSATEQFASEKATDIVKYGASAIAFKEVIEQLSKMTGSQSRNVYRALSLFDDIVKALDKAAPMFDKVLTTIVVYLQMQQNLHKTKKSLTTLF